MNLTSWYVNVAIKMLLGFIFCSCIFLLIAGYQPSDSYQYRSHERNIEILIMIFVMFYVGLSIFAVVKYLKVRRLKKILAIQFKDNIIPFTKKKYEELFEFIQRYPLKQQRLYNEFMPHAVAFGLDTSWNESFGVPTEVVVSSRAKQDLPDNIKGKISDSDFVEHK